MNIGITGHTSGIGKAIAEWFSERGHTIVGFSRSTGHDLSKPDMTRQIALSSDNIDVFVNNAFFRMGQVDLLYHLYDRWKDDPSKTILTISSNTGDVTKNYKHPYAVFKIALDEAVAQLQNTNPACRIMNLRPGYVDTPMVAHVSAKKLDPSYVAEVAGWMIEQPVLIRSLTLTP